MNDYSRTSLTRHAPGMRDADENGPRRLAARKWHEDGSVVLLADSVRRLDPLDRDLVRAIATRLYGPRGE